MTGNGFFNMLGAQSAARSLGAKALIGLFALAALAGCRAEEQGRVTSYQKGVYLGQADEQIDKETKDALRNRARRQSF